VELPLHQENTCDEGTYPAQYIDPPPQSLLVLHLAYPTHIFLFVDASTDVDSNDPAVIYTKSCGDIVLVIIQALWYPLIIIDHPIPHA
jgi:hypothetical protein